MQVLVVEDERRLAEAIAQILKEKKYLVVDSIVKTATRTGRAYAPIITKKEYEQQKALIQDVIQSSKIQSGILNFCNLFIYFLSTLFEKCFII